MKHNIRINGEIKEIDCQLGSGILDKHGREIFEGDNVRLEDGRIYPISFDYGFFHFKGKVNLLATVMNWRTSIFGHDNLEIVD